MIRRPPRSPLFPSTTLFRSQLDEPLFAVGGITREEVEAAIEANNQCWEGIRAFKWEHVCQGNYAVGEDRKSTRLNSSHANISYAVFCLKKKNNGTHLVRDAR